MVMANNKINKVNNKNAGELLAILIAMQMWQYNAGHISQWITSKAFLEATGCCHWASACAILPWQLLWLTILAANKNYSKT
jgi:hypothetical protein